MAGVKRKRFSNTALLENVNLTNDPQMPKTPSSKQRKLLQHCKVYEEELYPISLVYVKKTL